MGVGGGGRPQSGSSILWTLVSLSLSLSLSERHGSVRATRTERDLYCHLDPPKRFAASRCFRQQAACVVRSVPRWTRQAGRGPSRCVLSADGAVPSPYAAKPPSQTTNINMGAERRLPARSSPTDRGSRRTHSKALREGFPNAGAGTFRRPQGGPLSNGGGKGACPVG